MSELPLKITFLPVLESDFESLADLRVAAMRDSLLRVGRFDPERARARLRSSFAPEHTWSIISKETRVGFYAARPSAEGWHLDHLYILPDYQNRGVGEVVLRKVFHDADRNGVPIFVGALKESASNRFYLRHGFIHNGESEFDVFYVRPPVSIYRS